MEADTVLGTFSRDHLAHALAQVHRGGFGGNARVMDAARGDLRGQLTRAGIKAPPHLDPVDQLLLMVFAPGRVAAVVDLLQRAGARTIHVAERTNDATTAPTFGISITPRGRRPRPTPRTDRAATNETAS